jgi:DNA-binding transcriptional LysR family regulator
MELRHLRYFIAVAEEGHITRAAERLGMQQPPLSQQIKAIERELDVQLFRRKARGVELTDAGSRFLDEARVMIDQLNQAIDSTRRTARGELGRICLGVTSTSSFHPLVARAIRAFSESCPNVSLTLEESLSNDLLSGLRNERMDVAFIRTAPADAKDLTIERLLDEPMVVALSSDHPLARSTRNASISLKRLASESFILYGPPGTGMYDTIIAACHAAGFNPNVGNLGASTQQGPRIGSTLSLIAAGLGITFVPSSLQRMNIEGVAYRRVRTTTPPTARLSLATRRSDLSATVKQFITVVRKIAKTPLMALC